MKRIEGSKLNSRLESINKNRGVTFICQQLCGGGAERVICLLISYFRNRGYSVQVILLFSDRIDYDIPSDLRIEYLNWEHSKSPIHIISQIRELRRKIIYNNTIAFLFVPIFYTVFSTRLCGINTIVSERSDPSIDPPGIIRRTLRSLSYLLSDSVVFQTRDACRYFSRMIRKKGYIIENPISMNNCKLITIEREHRIVSVCRLTSQKNVMMSVDAFGLFLVDHPDYVFEIYGEGELEEEIDNYIRNKGLNDHIFIKGFCKDIHKQIRNAMMFVSSSDYEGISNSMLEAMALGLPVVCTDCPVGGARQVIKDGINGFLISMNKPYEMSEKMALVVSDKALREKVAENARMVCEEYNIERIGKKWEKLLL